MIDKKYIDITELRNWFQTYAEYDFNSKLATKVKTTFGQADGTTKTALIESIFAVTSQVQYYCKKNKVTIVSWWPLQHIILAYLRQALIQGRVVDSSNYQSFVAPIMATKTDQGDTAFKEVYVLQTLQALYKFRHDEIISRVYNFSIAPQNEGGSQSNVKPEIIIPSDTVINNNSSNNAVVPSGQINPPVITPDSLNQESSGMNPMLIGGAVLAILYMLTKKNKRK